MAVRSRVVFALALVVSVLVGCLPVEAQDSSLIVPGASIGPYRIGMTRAQVIAAVGAAPDIEDKTETNPPQPFIQYKGRGLTFMFNNEKVVLMVALAQKFRTTHGLGVGSTLQEVERAMGTDYIRKEGNLGPDLTYKDGIRFLFNGEQVIGVEVKAATTK